VYILNSRVKIRNEVLECKPSGRQLIRHNKKIKKFSDLSYLVKAAYIIFEASFDEPDLHSLMPKLTT